MSEDALREKLEAVVGRETEPQVARDSVNPAMIRHWCDAVEDGNPVYTDPSYADKSVHGGLVAPPTMMQAWTMPGLRLSDPQPPTVGPVREALRLLDEAGFTSVVATDCRQQYRRYLRPGDLLSVTITIESVSSLKQTALGAGHFVNQLMIYRDQRGEEVGRMHFRLLKFRPPARPADRRDGSRNDTEFRTRRYDEVQVGDELPVLEVPITPTRIVAGAIASRDYQVVHHDGGVAVERGSKDLFMNILTSNGYVGRYVTDWAGPEALLRSVDIRLGVPNYPGDLMRLTGRVAQKHDGVVIVELRGRNALGDHVTGSVELSLPAERTSS